MNFKSLDVADYNLLKTYFEGHPYGLSIYSLASLIAWSSLNYRSSYLLRNGILFIAGALDGSHEERHLILPVANGKVFSPAELVSFVRDLGFKTYRFVPENYLEKFDRAELESLFYLEEQSEFADYVYLTEDLIQLKGNKFSKKRNLISQFSREYLWKSRVSVEDIRREHIDACLEFLEIWCAERDCGVDKDSSLSCEKEALIKTLKNIESLEAEGILIRVDGKVSALGVGSRLNRTTGTLNFEKAFPRIKGLYQFLDNECAKRLFRDLKYINKESDMNIAALAESKRSYNPVMRIKSFAFHLR